MACTAIAQRMLTFVCLLVRIVLTKERLNGRTFMQMRDPWPVFCCVTRVTRLREDLGRTWGIWCRRLEALNSALH